MFKNTLLHKEFKMEKITGKKVLAFDLDGTLSQHRSHLTDEAKETLRKLGEKYKLIMLGAGNCRRIFTQMEGFPIDIIGNYGMQIAKYNPETKDIDLVFDVSVERDREAITKKIEYLREKYGFTEYAGESVEFHDSGMITFPLIGTKAKIEDKLAFDPDRSRRKVLYDEVCELFEGDTVFIGGTSSFDIAPFPYNKYYALDKFCKEYGCTHEEAAYFGDDIGIGGGDEQVYKSDFDFVVVKEYTDFPELAKAFLD